MVVSLHTRFYPSNSGIWDAETESRSPEQVLSIDRYHYRTMVSSVIAQLSLLDVARDLGILTIAAALIGYIAKQAISYYFTKEQKNFQSEIDKEIQRFQSELDKELQEFQSELDQESVVFSDLHQKRADIIAELYGKMSDFDREMKALVDPNLLRGDSREYHIEAAGESGEEFRRYYNRNKIYFPEPICETVEEIITEYTSLFHDFSVAEIHDMTTPNPGDKDNMSTRMENWESLTEDEIPELKEELEAHFRDLLGVSSEEFERTEL